MQCDYMLRISSLTHFLKVMSVLLIFTSIILPPRHRLQQLHYLTHDDDWLCLNIKVDGETGKLFYSVIDR